MSSSFFKNEFRLIFFWKNNEDFCIKSWYANEMPSLVEIRPTVSVIDFWKNEEDFCIKSLYANEMPSLVLMSPTVSLIDFWEE